MHVHVHFDDPTPDPRLDEILRLLRRVTTQEKTIMADLSALTNAIRSNSDAVDSAVTLIQELAQKISDAGTDPQALAALVDELNAKDAELAQAIVANTPADPAGSGDTDTPPTDTPPTDTPPSDVPPSA